MFWSNDKEEKNKVNGLYASLEDLVYQKKYLPYIKAHSNKITSEQAGDIRSAFKGRGMELEEVRAYGFGDDVRDIDWRVTARKGDTYTKVFSEEKDREVYVVLDLSPYMVFGTKKELKSVSASKIAALLGWQSMANKDRFGLVIYDGKETKVFKPQNNQKNLMAIFNAISQTSQDILEKSKEKESIEPNINDALKYLQFSIKSRAEIFIISDFNNITENALKTLITLKKRCKIYCINVYDFIEEVPPINGEYMVEYNNEKLIFDSSSDNFKDTYFQYFQKKRNKMNDFCKRFGCLYINIRTDRELYKQLRIL